MISVTIFINDNPIYTRSARNVRFIKDDLCEYVVDDGSIIRHKRGDGAVKLVKKMLDTIKELDGKE